MQCVPESDGPLKSAMWKEKTPFNIGDAITTVILILTSADSLHPAFVFYTHP